MYEASLALLDRRCISKQLIAFRDFLPKTSVLKTSSNFISYHAFRKELEFFDLPIKKTKNTYLIFDCS